jgi:hypothetical protein
MASLTKLAHAMVQYIAASSVLNERLAAANEKFAAEKRAALAMGPKILEAMLQHGAVRKDEKTAAANLLNSHTDTLDLLGRAVASLGATRQQLEKFAAAAPTLGQPERTTVKQASAPSSLSGPVVGGLTSKRRESDNVLARILSNPNG